jgi:hypothetical protein
MSRKYYHDFKDLLEHIPKEEAVSITLDWELPEVIRLTTAPERSDSLSRTWDPATHVVLLTDGSSDGNVTATTCTDYITKKHGAYCIEQLKNYTTIILKSANDDGECSDSTCTEMLFGSRLTSISHPPFRGSRAFRVSRFSRDSLEVSSSFRSQHWPF